MTWNKIDNLERCLVCSRKYDEQGCDLGKSTFSYKHATIPKKYINDGVIFKVCRECRNNTTMGQIIKWLCNIKKERVQECYPKEKLDKESYLE